MIKSKKKREKERNNNKKMMSCTWRLRAHDSAQWWRWWRAGVCGVYPHPLVGRKNKLPNTTCIYLRHPHTRMHSTTTLRRPAMSFAWHPPAATRRGLTDQVEPKWWWWWWWRKKERENNGAPVNKAMGIFSFPLTWKKKKQVENTYVYIYIYI